jgi:anaerobic selenocysteine-containing dehydrogenase
MPDGQSASEFETNPNRTAPSVCPLDCPDTCSLTVTVEENEVRAVRGSHANPITEGVVCNKVARYYPDFVHGKTRLRHPLVRVGAKGPEARFEAVSWETALDRVHGGFSDVIERFGAQAISPLAYAGPHGMLAMGSMDMRFFHKLGATRIERGPMCGGVKSEAHAVVLGPMPGTPPEQAEDAQLIVVWGNNVTVSNLHFTRAINRAKAKGAKVVVIDPKRIKVAQQADLHIALNPGTDVVLALAVAAELERLGGIDEAFCDRWAIGWREYLDAARAWSVERAAETCGVSADDIRMLARWYKEATPALISIGNGLERNFNGGNGIRAVLSLPCLAGKWGVRGGGAVSRPGLSVPKTLAKLQRPDLVPEGTRVVNMLDVPALMEREAPVAGAEADAPPVRGLFIYNHNPVAMFPDQQAVLRAFARDDVFIVGCEVQMTDSMKYCDVILPACSHFEHDDIFPAYGTTYLQRAEPVIPPVGEALPNTEIFRRLAARFGYDDPCFRATDAELMDDAVDGADARLGGLRARELPLDKAVNMTADGGEEIIPFANVFPATDSGKAELVSESAGARRGFALPVYRPLESAYPLGLITPSSSDRTNSLFGSDEASASTPELEIHPEDARPRGIATGMRVRVKNELGETVLIAQVTDAVRPGVVYSDKGAWFGTSESGLTVNALMPNYRADLCEGACFNDARCEVEPA